MRDAEQNICNIQLIMISEIREQQKIIKGWPLLLACRRILLHNLKENGMGASETPI